MAIGASIDGQFYEHLKALGQSTLPGGIRLPSLVLGRVAKAVGDLLSDLLDPIPCFEWAWQKGETGPSIRGLESMGESGCLGTVPGSEAKKHA